MSQLMMCISNDDLTHCHCTRICELEDKAFFTKAATAIFADANLNDCWVMGSFHSYCDEAHEEIVEKGIDFRNTRLFERLSEICDKSEKMAFWYSSFYEDLNQVYSKKQMLSSIGQTLIDPRFEMYLFFDRLEIDG